MLVTLPIIIHAIFISSTTYALQLSTAYHIRPSKLFQYDSSKNKIDELQEKQEIRLNKVLRATHSRRQADALIESGRITVNGNDFGAKGGIKVSPFVDTVELDGVLIQGWEKANGFSESDCENSSTGT